MNRYFDVYTQFNILDGMVKQTALIILALNLLLPMVLIAQESRSPHLYRRGESVKVTAFARMYQIPSSKSTTVNMVPEGTLLKITSINDPWVMVRYQNVTGWINMASIVPEKTDNLFFDTTYIEERTILGVPVNDTIILITLGSLLITILLLLFLYARSARNKNRIFAVLVCDDETKIRMSNTQQMVSIWDHLEEMGMTVIQFRHFRQCIRYLTKVDLIVLDYQCEPQLLVHIENYMNTSLIPYKGPIVFYNVEKPESLYLVPTVAHSTVLGTNLSDRDFAIALVPILGINRKSHSKSSSALEGKLTDESWLELLQFIEMSRKTGTLMIQKTKILGKLCFEGGLVRAAYYGNMTGDKAAMKLLSVREGYFYLSSEPPSERNCMIPITGLLMAWTQIKDEGIKKKLSSLDSDDYGTVQKNEDSAPDKHTTLE